MSVFIAGVILIFFVFPFISKTLGASSSAPKVEHDKTQVTEKSGSHLDSRSEAAQTALRKSLQRRALNEYSRDPNDKNKSRRDDWGQRAQDDKISLKNILLIIAVVCGVFYVFSLMGA